MARYMLILVLLLPAACHSGDRAVDVVREATAQMEADGLAWEDAPEAVRDAYLREAARALNAEAGFDWLDGLLGVGGALAGIMLGTPRGRQNLGVLLGRGATLAERGRALGASMALMHSPEKARPSTL